MSTVVVNKAKVNEAILTLIHEIIKSGYVEDVKLKTIKDVVDLWVTLK